MKQTAVYLQPNPSELASFPPFSENNSLVNPLKVVRNFFGVFLLSVLKDIKTMLRNELKFLKSIVWNLGVRLEKAVLSTFKQRQREITTEVVTELRERNICARYNQFVTATQLERAMAREMEI